MEHREAVGFGNVEVGHGLERVERCGRFGDQREVAADPADRAVVAPEQQRKRGRGRGEQRARVGGRCRRLDAGVTTHAGCRDKPRVLGHRADDRFGSREYTIEHDHRFAAVADEDDFGRWRRRAALEKPGEVRLRRLAQLIVSVSATVAAGTLASARDIFSAPIFLSVSSSTSRVIIG